MARYALVIGIGQNQPPLASIPQAVADAEAMATLLETHGNFRVTLLRGLVNKAELAQAFKQFWQQAANSEALIFYSGHGLQVVDDFDPTEVVLAASDCGVRVEGQQIVGVENGLKLNSLNQKLAEARFSNLVMLLDCCHSGFLLEEGPLKQMFGSFQGRDYVLLTACRTPMKIQGRDRQQFQQALLSAFPSKAKLEQMLSFELDWDLNAIAGGQNQSDIIFNLIKHAEAQGKLRSLLSAARKANRSNPVLQKFALRNDIDVRNDNAAHSVFTGAVLAGLAEEQADEQGIVTAQPLIGFVLKTLRQGQQEPVSLGVGREVPIVQYRQSVNAAEVSEECPYQGLEAFTDKSQQFFFGRSTEVAELTRRLYQSGFVPVVGPSGMGKSSVVRAGLIPRLEAEGCQVITMKPDEDPFLMLKQALKRHWDGKISRGEQRRLWEQLETNREDEQGLVLLAEAMPGTEPLLLVVDQFEEVFTLCKPEVARAFVRQLVAVGQVASERSFRLAIVLTMRSEFVNDWLVMGQPPRVLQEQTLFIGPLLNVGEAEAEQRLTQAIVRPAQVQGYGFGEGLLELILADVEAEPNSLPLLEFALTQLWAERDQEKRLLMAATYRRISGLKGALNQRAEEVYGSLSEAEKDWARRVCLQLVRIGKGETDTRQRQPKAKMLQLANGSVAQKQRIEDVIGELVKGRLLVSDGDDGGATIDLAHEALMGGWERFVQWRQQDRKRQRLKQEVEDNLEKWKEQGQNKKYLMQGGLFAEVKAIEEGKRSQVLDTYDLQRFFQLSNNLERESSAARRASAKVKILERCRDIANSPSASTVEQALRIIDLVGESQQKLQEVVTPVQDVLHQILVKLLESGRLEKSQKRNEHPLCLWEIKAHTSSTYSIAFSPDGNDIVSCSFDNPVLKLWDLEGQAITYGSDLPTDFYADCRGFSTVAFSPDGDCIASTGTNGSLYLWDLTGRMTKEFPGCQISTFAFSPNGEQIISGGRDGTLRLWNLKDESKNKIFQDGHQFEINSVAFRSNGTHIVSGDRNSVIQLWDFEGQKLGEPFRNPEDDNSGNPVWAVAFNPKGDRIISGSRMANLQLWDLGGHLVRFSAFYGDGQPVRGHSRGVPTVAFSPRGDYIVSGSEDSTVRLWDSELHAIGEPFQGHSHEVNSVTFSPKGDYIVSGDDNGTIRLWRGGTWQDWLRDCCNQLIYHSDLVDPKTDYAHRACEVCKNHAWTRQETAKFLRAQAHSLTHQGKTEAAEAKLAEAERLDPKPEN